MRGIKDAEIWSAPENDFLITCTLNGEPYYVCINQYEGELESPLVRVGRGHDNMVKLGATNIALWKRVR